MSAAPHGVTPRALLDRVASALKDARSVLITTHITPDGDALGSALALARHLRARVPKVRFVNCSATPSNLRFLIRPGEYAVYDPERHERVVTDADVIIATDIGGSARLGRMLDPIRRSRARRIVIDHHRLEDDLFDVACVVPSASSSAEITYDLLRHLGAEFDRDLAEPLYVGLISDTGGFSYQATSPRAHRMAAHLLEMGVDPHQMWRKLSCQASAAKTHVLGLCLSDLRFEEQGRIVWTGVDQQLLLGQGIPARDAFEVVNHFLHVKGVEAGAFFLEVAAERTKVSLRSAGTLDVGQIAAHFGGGGHAFAAGCTIEGLSFQGAKDSVLDALVRGIRGVSEDDAAREQVPG